MKQEDLFNLGRKMKLDDRSYARIQANIGSKKKIISNSPKAYLKLAFSALSYIFCVSFILIIIAGVRTLKESPLSIGGEVSTSKSHSSIVSSVCSDVSSKTESIIEVSQPVESVEESTTESMIEVSQPTEESRIDVSDPNNGDNEDPIDYFFKEYGTVENYLKLNPIYEYQNEAAYPVYINKTYNAKERTEHIYTLISKLGISDEVEIENHEDFDVTSGYIKKKFNIYFESHGSYSINLYNVNTKGALVESDCINQTKNYIERLKGDLEGLNYKSEQNEYALTIYIYSNSTDIIDKYPLFEFTYNIYGNIYIKCYRNNSELYNKYPIKTVKEAEDSMLAGNYFGALGAVIPQNAEYNIIACDLQYITNMNCEFIQPCYVFVLELYPGTSKSYIWRFFVQAIQDEYIESEKIYIEYRGQ